MGLRANPASPAYASGIALQLFIVPVICKFSLHELGHAANLQQNFHACNSCRTLVNESPVTS